MEKVKLNREDWEEAEKTSIEQIKQALRVLALNKELLKLAKRQLKKFPNKEKEQCQTKTMLGV